MSESADQAPVRAGEILAGKYRVERVLGVGGMGIVVAATHLHLQQLVALKFVLPAMARDAQAVERFLREARAAVRLKSAHVAKVLDVGTLENGAPFMVMEFLEGTDLSGLLEKNGALSIEDAADYVVQACEALAEAHSIGLVHRDLKPHNLFLTRGVGGGALVKVLDFGISKIIDQNRSDAALTRTSAMMGSPLYMSPEQMRSARDVDARSDIWALGVILYQLLTNALPFEADSITSLVLAVTQASPTPLETHRAGIPEPLRRIVLRCLEKHPGARFEDAGELATALAPFARASSAQTVERARMAISTRGPSSLPASTSSPSPIGLAPTQQSAPAIAASPASAAAPAATGGTWAEGQTGAPAPPRESSLLRYGLLLALLIGAGVTAVVLLTNRAPTDARVTTSPSASQASSAASLDVTAKPKGTPAATASTTAPAMESVAASAPASGAAPAAGAAATTDSATVATTKPLAIKPIGKPLATGITSATKPLSTVTDDGIPTSR